MNEQWKPVKGYEGLYEVSNIGRIRSNNTRDGVPIILRQLDSGNGYLYVSLCTGNKKKNYYIHRLVAEAFCENKGNKKEIHHIDENKQNNHYTNLMWVTRGENIRYSAHAYRGRRVVKTNTGERYISKQRSDGRYRVTLDKKQLGTFATLEEAIAFRNARW